jgi:hypothetical protein
MGADHREGVAAANDAAATRRRTPDEQPMIKVAGVAELFVRRSIVPALGAIWPP